MSVLTAATSSIGLGALAGLALTSGARQPQHGVVEAMLVNVHVWWGVALGRLSRLK